MNAILSYRNWQSKKDKVSCEDAEKYYEVENELFLKALDIARTKEMENQLIFANSSRQKLIESRSRCFGEIGKASLESIVERLANLTAAIN